MRYDTIIDSRDLANRLEELESLRDTLEELRAERKELGEITLENGDEASELDRRVDDALDAFGDDEQQELKDLENAESEIPEWQHGNALIPRDGWIQYVKDMLEDCGDIPKNLPPYIEIDWYKTSSNIEADYSKIEIQGTTYLYLNC